MQTKEKIEIYDAVTGKTEKVERVVKTDAAPETASPSKPAREAEKQDAGKRSGYHSA